MAETIKIAVCDDEKNIRFYLVSLIEKQGGECSITEYASADAYLSDEREQDLIFLDIEMGSSGAGLDGMGLARHIRGMEAQKQPIIIFVTGYEKYAYDAFDVGAFQYLVKPMDEQKFAEVFGRAVGQVLSEAEQRKKKLVIQYGGEGKARPALDDSRDSSSHICRGRCPDLFLAEIPHPACRETETFCGGAAGKGHEETLGGSGEFLWKHLKGAPRDEEPYGEH